MLRLLGGLLNFKIANIRIFLILWVVFWIVVTLWLAAITYVLWSLVFSSASPSCSEVYKYSSSMLCGDPYGYAIDAAIVTLFVVALVFAVEVLTRRSNRKYQERLSK